MDDLQGQLLQAAKEGNAELVARLLQAPRPTAGKNSTSPSLVHQYANEFGESPLHLATLRRHAAVVELLLQPPRSATSTSTAPADVNAQTKDGKTALFLACRDNQVGLARLLLQHGANVDLANAKGTTPLLIASLNNHRDVVSLLLASGANLAHKDAKGNTALDNCRMLGHDKLAAALERTIRCLNASSQPSGKGNSGKTVLDQVGSVAAHTAEAYLLFGQVQVPGSTNGEYLLHAACRLGSLTACQALVRNGAQVDLPTAAGQQETPLIVAARHGHLAIVKFLCHHGHGARVTATDLAGNTALHHACRRRDDDGTTANDGQTGLVYFLLGAGGVGLQSATNRMGQTALDVARETEAADEIVEFLSS